MVSIFIGGHDSTTIALSAMIFLLAKHQNWQNILREESFSIYEKTKSEVLPHEEMGNLENTEHVFKETLRLYAPVRFLFRRSMANFEFQGYKIPRNTLLVISPHFSHISGERFDDPLEFNPNRFSQSEGNDLGSWIPFGKGAHTCIGMHLAHIEVKAFFYQFLRKFKVSVEEDYVFSMTPSVFGLPKDGVPIILDKL